MEKELDVDVALLFCERCKCESMQPKKINKKSVTVVCSNCGVESRVTCGVGTIHLGEGWGAAIEESREQLRLPTGPEGGDVPESSVGTVELDDGEAFTFFRVRLLESQKAMILRALRVMKAQTKVEGSELRGKLWRARALELIMAEYMAGAPQEVLALVPEEEPDEDADPSQMSLLETPEERAFA